MNTLVNEITKQVGISEKEARKAVTLTADYLKHRIPEPLATEVAGMLELGEKLNEEEANLVGLFPIP